ncbi:hypothetical protein [Streptomyces sp. NPDC056707]|uniref:hypothetical protein n=1 Tax=Streptomyces sp. NPDC056707 TaxID=3345919 RepID=UPI0036C55232
MAFTSYPFSSSPLSTEAQYALTASRWGNDGVHTDDLSSTALKVTANGTSSVSIAAGSGFVNGATVENDAVYSLSVVSNSGGSSARKDLVVLRYDASADSIIPVYKTGGTTAPSLTNSPSTGVVEIPLAECTVAAGASVVGSTAVVDRRWGVGRPVSYGTATSRPPSRKGHVRVEGNDIVLGDGTNWLYLGTAGDPAWTAYTPGVTAGSTTVNFGSGAVKGFYKIVGKTCHLDIQVVPTANPAALPDPLMFTLPVAARGLRRSHFTAHMESVNGEGGRNGVAFIMPTISVVKISRVRFSNSDGTTTNWLTNSPINFRNGDTFGLSGSYEIA